MKRKVKSSAGNNNTSLDSSPVSDFYASASGPEVSPLYGKQSAGSFSGTRKTGRHYKSERDSAVDIRDKIALITILRLSLFAFLLLIALVLVWKGIGIYENNLMMEQSKKLKEVEVVSPVIASVDFNIDKENSKEHFEQRVEEWKKADRIVRSVDGLIKRKLYDLALTRCNEALMSNPAHAKAMELLGQIYYETGDYGKSINILVRLLDTNPSNSDIKKKLMRSFDDYGKMKELGYLASWYLDENLFDAQVQRYLANSLYAQGDYTKAVVAYKRALEDNPEDFQSKSRLAQAYMQLKDYESAHAVLLELRAEDYENPEYHRLIIFCRAQLKQPQETINALGRATQVFGQSVVVAWMKDPMLDPVREDRAFQTFTDRVAGEDFRLWQERLAHDTRASQKEEDLTLKLDVPHIKVSQNELLDGK